MEYGRVAGIETPVSRLVQGTTMVRPDDLSGSFALLDAVFDLGCTAFDTARNYGDGNEGTVGRWVRERRRRDAVVIIGKGAHHSRERKRVTPDDIRADIETSLDRFGFDHVDLYLLHRDDPSVPVAPIIDALNEHQRAGKIRAFGASNWTHERIEEANAYATAEGLTPFAVSSPNFSLAEQVQPPWADCVSITGAAGAAARDWYARERMPIFAWSSLAGGFFSGRFPLEQSGEPDDPSDRLCLASYGSEANFARLERARRLGEERGLSLAQVALAWLLNQPLEVFPLVGCRSGEEFKANLDATAVRLTDEEVAWLDLRRDDGAVSAS